MEIKRDVDNEVEVFDTGSLFLSARMFALHV